MADNLSSLFSPLFGGIATIILSTRKLLPVTFDYTNKLGTKTLDSVSEELAKWFCFINGFHVIYPYTRINYYLQW